MTQNKVLRVPANTQGSDYIIGDLHGCLDELESLMRAVGFDAAFDRLFSSGDIIDRGPYSVRALELLCEPWFFTVKGNHEEMMECAMRGTDPSGKYDYPANMWTANGGDWVLGDMVDIAILKNFYYHKLAKLPLVIHVDGEGSAKFNIVHAELIAHEPLTDANLDTVVLKEDNLLWGRKYIYEPSKHFATQHLIQTDELSLVYCGHTPVTSPRPFLRQLCIDTGCVYSYPDNFDDTNCLTMVKPATGESFRCYSSDMRVETHDLRGIINNFYIRNTY